ncbi:SNF2-related protein [Phytohabitans sp. LJ34]|uniref:SNF2-related protein n=1 Tax=Phytohabitans sp. LJ34 TaxID=3452217 RepID=UPI003F8A5217
MSERVTVERTLTEEMLNLGEIPLGPAEQRRLRLGDHSTALVLIADRDEVPAVWTAGRRRLTGEALLEHLQDTGRVGDLVRLERQGDGPIDLVVRTPARGLSAGGRDWSRSLPQREEPARRESASQLRARRRASSGARYRLRQREEYAWHGDVGFLREARSSLLEALRSRGWDPADAVQMRLEGERLATLDQFEELLAVDAAHIEHMPHQEAAARTVLARMNGRGILADEVGLGKTVEGGLVLKELLLRGLAERVLIVCPAPLREQWRDELKTKFDEDFVVIVSGQDSAAFSQIRMIMTLQLLLRNADRLGAPFDLVIVDEAHRLAGSGARRTREVVGQLVRQAPRALFLTATPVQNNLLELYRLVELLRPGTFRSERDFRDRFVHRSDPRRPVNAPELRKLVSSVVVRTTRQQAGVDKVHRMPPQDHGVHLTPPERQLYDLVLRTLRHRMTAPGDHSRRRSLAHKLTASPHAMSRSALRMAEGHPDPLMRAALTEIGHLAGEIHHTAREQTALKIVRKWLDEHGRVLLFTQHTQTLDGLLRLMDAEGIAAVPFHGSMAHSARAESVADFRSGKAQVLVSTDAGAEGQNLQVSNCVLNYDLPWNPMRVEQRIGRVHRLTQTRDVHIANIFARDTLDEAVYRLLHDKLAMFELLFGQVVTVLGELDGDQDATMEKRILEALLEKSDATMQRRLDALGAELEQARTKAMHMITTDSGLSAWLAQRQEERQQRAAQPQARELLPQPADRPRRRQQDLERFVCRFLEMAGAELSQPEEGLTRVKLPADMDSAFDGRDELFLAFTHTALDLHPEAELCVVGSEVFDELLRVLREHGDLTGSIAELPAIPQEPVLAHVPGVVLRQRRLQPTGDWSARATYRVQEGATSGNQRLVSVDVGPARRPDAPRVAILDGAPPPAQLTESGVLEAVERQAASDLAEQLRQARQAEERRQAESRDRMLDNLREQLAETEQTLLSRGVAGYEELTERHQQLSRAIRTAEQSSVAPDQTELRAELLTLEVHGSDQLEVVEYWERTAGGGRELRYAWTGDLADHGLRCEATGEPLTTMALCTDMHVVDASALVRCDLCNEDRCAACGPQRVVVPCAACQGHACGPCRFDGALCAECRDPHRAPDLDTEWEHGWRLGAGTHLLVGTRHATFVGPAGRRVDLVPDADVDDPLRVRLRGLAARFGLPASAGLVAAARIPAAEELAGEAAWSDVEQSVWWTCLPSTGGQVDAELGDLLPEITGPAVVGEVNAGFDGLLAELRGREPAPPVPAVAAVPFAVVRRVDLRGARITYRELWHEGAGEPMVAAADTQPLLPSRHEVSPFCRPVARATVGPVTIEFDGLHRSYVGLLTDGSRTSTIFVPGWSAATVGMEEKFAGLVTAAGLPPTRRVVRHPWPGVAATELRYLDAAPDTEAHRKVSTLWTLVDSAEGEIDAAAAVTDVEPVEFAGAKPVANEPLRHLLEVMDEPVTSSAIAPCLLVDEEWRSPHGRAERRYLVAPATPIQRSLLTGRLLVHPGGSVAAPLDGPSTDDDPVTVDTCGHLIGAGRSMPCPVCARVYGPCCAPHRTVVSCRTCRRPACGVCRSASTPAFEATQCQRCGDYSCADCSRRLPVRGCTLCGRIVCAACTGDGNLCGTCRSLAPATDDELAALPDELAAGGLAVLIGHDPAGSVALLAGEHRAEVAVFSATGLHRWETAHPDARQVLQARIAAAHLAGTGDIEIQVVDGSVPPFSEGAIVLLRHGSTRLVWGVLNDGALRAGDAPTVPGRNVAGPPNQDLLEELNQALQAAGTKLRLPAPTSAPRDEVIRRVASVAHLPTGRGAVVVSRQATESAVLIDSRGLVRRTAIGPTVTEEVAEWRPANEPIPWAGHGWMPAPDLVAVAAKDGFTAVLAAVGAHALLGVQHGVQAPAWYMVTEPAWDDLARGALGAALLGRPALLSVNAITAPRTLIGPAVINSRRIARRVWPDPVLASPDAAPLPKPAIPPATALAQILPHVKVAAPHPRDELPATLTSALRQRLSDHTENRVRGGIGLRVEEDWQLPDGTPIKVGYRVAPNATNGYLPDAVTGQPLRLAHVCRSHHVVSGLEICSTCRTGTCGACPDSVRPCALCGDRLCGRCVANTYGCCQACAALRKVGVLSRSRLGIPRGADGWHGQSRTVRVIVRRIGDQWFLERASDAAPITTALTGDRLLLAQRVLGGRATG